MVILPIDGPWVMKFPLRLVVGFLMAKLEVTLHWKLECSKLRY